MPKIPLVSQTAQKVSDISFELKKAGSARIVAQAVVTALTNQRTVSAHTKTRDEVRGGGKKPWKQKGTGRARHGSIRSPIWVGGGVTFGPRNLRNFTKSMNKAQRDLALRTVLAQQAEAGRLSVIEQMPTGIAKTRDAVAFFKNVCSSRAYLVIVDPEFNASADASALHQAVRNTKTINIRSVAQVSTADVAGAHAIIMTKAAFDYLTA